MDITAWIAIREDYDGKPFMDFSLVFASLEDCQRATRDYTDVVRIAHIEIKEID